MGLSQSWESRHHTREHTEYTVSGGMGEAPERFVPLQWEKVRMILGGHQKCPLHQHIDKGVTRVSGKDEEALDREFTNLDPYLTSFSNKLIELGESFHLSRSVLCHF